MDILKLNPKRHPLTDQQKLNLQRLHFVLERIEKVYKRTLIVNRGYSTIDEQIEIYKEINEKREAKGLPPLKVPMESGHCKAAAADISDIEGKLWAFLMTDEGLALRLELGIALESKRPTWVHIQIYLPKSGHLVFDP